MQNKIPPAVHYLAESRLQHQLGYVGIHVSQQQASFYVLCAVLIIAGLLAVRKIFT